MEDIVNHCKHIGKQLKQMEWNDMSPDTMQELTVLSNTIRQKVEELDWDSMPLEEIEELLNIIDDLLVTLEEDLQAEIERQDAEYMRSICQRAQEDRWRCPQSTVYQTEYGFDSRDEI